MPGVNTCGDGPPDQDIIAGPLKLFAVMKGVPDGVMWIVILKAAPPPLPVRVMAALKIVIELKLRVPEKARLVSGSKAKSPELIVINSSACNVVPVKSMVTVPVIVSSLRVDL
jgi:hypothetical protein